MLKRSFFIAASLIIIVLILVFKSNPSIFAPKTKGSFEYVRAGEALLDKGNYKRAIADFEKALAESPDNKVIKSNLAYAYTRYAGLLAESADYGSAIEYLTKAYEVLPGTNTAQGLAIMYSKRAMHEAHKGEWALALEDFAAARSAVEDSVTASKNLSVSLFNDAVSEYSSGRDRTAVILLKEAALAYDGEYAFELLGDIYYRKTELDKARFYWERARGLNPENKQLLEKLEKLQKETGLEMEEGVVGQAHFEIRCEKGLSVDRLAAGEVLEKAYLDIGKDLAYFPADKTVVFFYSEANFRKVFNMPDIVRAFYDGNIRMPYPENIRDREGLEHYIYHEYAHAVVSAKTNNNSPVWFGEGVAVWEEFRSDPSLIEVLLKKTGDISGKVSIRSLEEAFSSGGKSRSLKAEEMRTYYLVAYTVVGYIVDTWGVEGLRDIMDRAGKGQHIMNAIDDEFLLSEKEFEKRWVSYVRKKFYFRRVPTAT